MKREMYPSKEILKCQLERWHTWLQEDLRIDRLTLWQKRKSETL